MVLMKERRPHAHLVLSMLALVACHGGTAMPPRAAHATVDDAVDFRPWTEEAFEDARRERRLLLVSVQASFCHFCHVMNDVTYRDPEVLRLLADHFVVIRVDADARPDLAERYARFAWPATAVLTPDAEPVVELRGYQPPRGFARLLSSVVRDLERGRPIARRTPRAPLPVAPEGDDRALTLVRAALGTPHPGRIVVRETPETSRYPYDGSASAFVCTRSSCSSPIEDPSRLRREITRALGSS
jgi:uncharacterized protein YyaL (SSP411 family)